MYQLLLSEVTASAECSKMFTALNEKLNMPTRVAFAFCALFNSRHSALMHPCDCQTGVWRTKHALSNNILEHVCGSLKLFWSFSC